jgi:hypothetical protein
VTYQEFRYLVKELRTYQKRYKIIRDKADLDEALRLAARVDEELARPVGPAQATLFAGREAYDK